MLMAILTDLPFVHRAMKDFRVFQVRVKAALGGETVVGGQTSGKGVLTSSSHPHPAVIGIVPKHFGGDADLPKIVQALSFSSPLTTTNQAWQQHAGEDAYDGNNDEQLDKRECNPFARPKLS